MGNLDRIIQLVISVFLIVGFISSISGASATHGSPRQFRLPMDDKIPYRPRWVWVYSFLYYPVIVAINWSVTSPRHFLYVALSYMLLLVLQMMFFTLMPWQRRWNGERSTRDEGDRNGSWRLCKALTVGRTVFPACILRWRL
jgi:hypothetical protein